MAEIIDDLKSVIGGVGGATVDNQDKLNALAAISATHTASIKSINEKLDELTPALADITNKINSAPTGLQNALVSSVIVFSTAREDDGARYQGKRKTAAELNSRG